ncbi:hypothetical protein E0Z10_g3674 [Xylaria hypoxylon]|uniref:Uncharacterized protein n=1 Tax=Xylaria hypoxylon TaxID=37992 RepID=A0A4Z0Z0P1_9PEZI|nr:hypothetical protein E0Z10_g3674 [Xylaria hypoxylon]
MPSQEELIRMREAAIASREKRRQNKAEKEYQERKEAENRVDSAGRVSKERRKKWGGVDYRVEDADYLLNMFLPLGSFRS